MTKPHLSYLIAALALGVVACDDGDDDNPLDDGADITQNNENGYCWSKPTDCWDMIPLEDDMHYHCCFDTTGYYCDSDEQLHVVECDYACSYDAAADLIYCAAGPDQGPGGETQPIPPGSHF